VGNGPPYNQENPGIWCDITLRGQPVLLGIIGYWPWAPIIYVRIRGAKCRGTTGLFDKLAYTHLDN